MLSFLFPIVFFSSGIGLVYLIFKKIPKLIEIPRESLTNQETFIQFVLRISKAFIFALNPKRLKIYLLSNTATALNKLRIWFLRMYHLIEIMAKKARQESQKMEWEHHWFSSKEIEKNKEPEKKEETSDEKKTPM